MNEQLPGLEMPISTDGHLSWATLSDDGVYRYVLGRRWGDGQGAGRVVWVLLNPSTADATRDDATVRKCVGFSKLWGYDELVIVNLFAFRSRHPAVLDKQADPVGPDNPGHLGRELEAADRVVCGWGGAKIAAPVGLALLDHLRELPDDERPQLGCIGLTLAGHPKHPLFPPYDSRYGPWPRYPYEDA